MTPSAVSQSVVARDARVISNATKIRYTPFAPVRGDGARMIDADGRSFLDFTSAWAVAPLGYSDSRLQAAVREQYDRITFAGLGSAINKPAVELAEKLIALTPGDFPKKVWFGLAGSDASEAAQRLLLNATGKQRMVSFIGSWHGTTTATMALSGHPSFSAMPGGAHVTKVPYPNPYRNPFGDNASDQTGQCLRFLEDYLFKTICPPEDVAAVWVEAVQADSGDIVPPPDFLPALRALCDRHDILLVVDEIKTGLGRTGRMFAYEHAEIVPDVVLLGKSLGGGLPLSAIVGRADIIDAGSAIMFTTVGNATCCAAGVATIDAILEDDLVNRAAENGAYLLEGLRATLLHHEIVGDIRGLGMIQGVELVTDRASKEPNQRAAAKIVFRAWELGLIVYYAGNWGNVLEITPPLILSRAEIDEGIAILDQAITDVLVGMVSDEAVAPYSGW